MFARASVESVPSCTSGFSEGTFSTEVDVHDWSPDRKDETASASTSSSQSSSSSNGYRGTRGRLRTPSWQAKEQQEDYQAPKVAKQEDFSSNRSSRSTSIDLASIESDIRPRETTSTPPDPSATSHRSSSSSLRNSRVSSKHSSRSSSRTKRKPRQHLSPGTSAAAAAAAAAWHSPTSRAQWKSEVHQASSWRDLVPLSVSPAAMQDPELISLLICRAADLAPPGAAAAAGGGGGGGVGAAGKRTKLWGLDAEAARAVEEYTGFWDYLFQVAVAYIIASRQQQQGRPQQRGKQQQQQQQQQQRVSEHYAGASSALETARNAAVAVGESSKLKAAAADSGPAAANSTAAADSASASDRPAAAAPGAKKAAAANGGGLVFTGRQLSGILWSCASRQLQPPRPWLQQLWLTSIDQLPRWSTQQLSKAAWALTNLQVQPPKPWVSAFLAAAEPQLGECEPRQLGFIIRAVARMGWEPGRRWVALAGKAVAEVLPECNSQDVAVILCGLAVLQLDVGTMGAAVANPSPPLPAAAAAVVQAEVQYGRVAKSAAGAAAVAKGLTGSAAMEALDARQQQQPSKQERHQQKQQHRHNGLIAKPHRPVGLYPGPTHLSRQLLASFHQHLSSFQPNELAVALWAVAKLRLQPPSEVLLDCCGVLVQRLERFSVLDVANVMWAWARFRGSKGAWRGHEEAEWQRQQQQGVGPEGTVQGQGCSGKGGVGGGVSVEQQQEGEVAGGFDGQQVKLPTHQQQQQDEQHGSGLQQQQQQQGGGMLETPQPHLQQHWPRVEQQQQQQGDRQPQPVHHQQKQQQQQAQREASLPPHRLHHPDLLALIEAEQKVLLALLSRALQLAPTASGPLLSGLLSSVAKLGVCPPPSWMAQITWHCQARLHAMSPWSLAVTLWSLGSLGYNPGAAWVQQAYAASVQMITGFSPQGLGNIGWAMMRLQLQPPPWWKQRYSEACAAAMGGSSSSSSSIGATQSRSSSGRAGFEQRKQQGYRQQPWQQGDGLSVVELCNMGRAVLHFSRVPGPPWPSWSSQGFWELWLQQLQPLLHTANATALALVLAVVAGRKLQPWESWWGEYLRCCRGVMLGFSGEGLAILGLGLGARGVLPDEEWVEAWEAAVAVQDWRLKPEHRRSIGRARVLFQELRQQQQQGQQQQELEEKCDARQQQQRQQQSCKEQQWQQRERHGVIAGSPEAHGGAAGRKAPLQAAAVADVNRREGKGRKRQVLMQEGHGKDSEARAVYSRAAAKAIGAAAGAAAAAAGAEAATDPGIVAVGVAGEAAGADDNAAAGVESEMCLALHVPSADQEGIGVQASCAGSKERSDVEDVFWAARQGMELRMPRHVVGSPSRGSVKDEQGVEHAMMTDGEGGAQHLLATV